ncbi:hypothetical protein HanRHA438_Chr04g0165381 [Helianthus annuus]|nr:hypothetical protein HanRHA438_Chr04g0165381 [Helianthus annuus]
MDEQTINCFTYREPTPQYQNLPFRNSARDLPPDSYDQEEQQEQEEPQELDDEKEQDQEVEVQITHGKRKKKKKNPLNTGASKLDAK